MRAAVIPTHDRPKDFADCVAAIRPQVDLVVAVSHGAGYATRTPGVDVVVPYVAGIPNISTMWRLGIAAAGSDTQWVALLNDDAIAPPGWFDALQAEADRTHAVGASGWRAQGVRKIAGFAFILDITSGVRPDERFRWWYSDDAIQRRCEAVSQFALVERVTIEHRYPNRSTQGVLRRISRADKPRFERAYHR